MSDTITWRGYPAKKWNTILGLTIEQIQWMKNYFVEKNIIIMEVKKTNE